MLSKRKHAIMDALIFKIKTTGFIALASFLTLSMQAQVRNTEDFTGIKVDDSFNILISQGSANTINVDAPERVQSQIKTEVKDGILIISGEGTIKTEKPVIISIGVKSINAIIVSGSGEVKTQNLLICDKLTLESSGAGDIHLNVKANEIKGQLSGSGDITLSGTAQYLDATVSGAGDFKASNLETDKAKILVSGAGDAKVYVKKSLDADVSGAGSIIYKGNPTERNVSISGAGSVRESTSGTGEETANGSTKFRLGKKRYMIIDEEDEGKSPRLSNKDSLKSYNRKFKHWTGLEVGVNGFLDYKNSLDAPANGSFLELNYARSLQFGINLLEKNFHIYKNYINAVIGFGFDFNHYALMNDLTIHSDSAYLSATNDNIDYTKNTLNVSYIKVPLLLEINTSSNPKKNFHISGGLEFAYRIHSVLKQEYDMNGKHHDVKQRDDFKIDLYRYSTVLRIGYNNVSIFADYGLNRLFKKGKGPQVYPFTIGLTVSL